MSDTKIARAPFVYLNPPVLVRTWLDVKEALPAVKGLTERACADCVSALNTVGNMYRLPGEKLKDVDLALARMEADPRLVTKFLDRMNAAKKGYRGGSWNNITYRVNKAMRVTGAGHRIGNNGRPIADERFHKLPKLPYQASLAALMRYLQAERIALEDLTSEIFAKFGVWLEAIPDLRMCPRTTFLAARRALRGAAENFPEFWPPTFVTVQFKHDNRYLLPWTAFAPEFLTDAKRRTEYVVNPPLDDPNARPVVEKHVADKQEMDIRRLASALVVQTGRDAKTIKSVADLVTLEAFAAILQFLLDRLQKKDPKAVTSGGLFVSAGFLCSLAKNWVRLDSDEVKKLYAIARRRNPNPAARG